MHERDLDRSDPNLLEIGIGQLIVAEAPKRLLTPALGSCVGVALYDAHAMRGGLSHIMLPSATGNGAAMHGGRFADQAIAKLVRMLDEAGSPRRRLRAKIAGGATMFRGEAPISTIGDRNVAEVKRQLTTMHIALEAEDTGESYARTIELELATGELIVRSYQFGVRRL